jgi:hypothetical protein
MTAKRRDQEYQRRSGQDRLGNMAAGFNLQQKEVISLIIVLVNSNEKKLKGGGDDERSTF